MTDSSSQEALERRRTQNREAQRRFRRKRTLQASVDWNEVLSNALGPTYGPTYIDIQSQELPSSDASFSPTSHPSASFTSALGYFGCLTPPHSECSPQDADKFLEQASSSSTQNIDPTFSSSRPSPPAGSITRIQAHDTFSGNFSSNTPLTRSGSVASTGQGYSLGSESPSDYTCTLSSTSTCGWLSPLHMAARRGNDRIAWLLLQQGVDCNEKDSDGLTPIMHGVIGGHEEVVRSLLLHGADIGDDSGKQRPSALHLARTRG
ncbi:hypothetical protein F5Y13DRAFT_151870 [Hypoxylon sp. FL1857]|nr:hypothetical protein F5Y13DRAFT_151870 [Hypoxylon sp. FL1857]